MPRTVTPGVESYPVCPAAREKTHDGSVVCFLFDIPELKNQHIRKGRPMKKLISVILAALMLLSSVLALASCGGVNAADDLKKVKAADKLVVGMECAYAPYNWAQPSASEYTVKLSNNTYADGYDVQIARKIAEWLNVELEIVPTEWDGLIPSLQSGSIDMIIAGMSPTEDRKLSIDFSDTYFDSNLVIVVKKDGPYAGATELAGFSGAKITGQLNTFHYKVIDQIPGVNKQTELQDFAALIQALDSGAIDGYVCEKPGAVSATASNSSFTFVEFAAGKGFECDPADSSISVGLRKGSSLTAEVNKVVGSISATAREEMMNAAIARQPAE